MIEVPARWRCMAFGHVWRLFVSGSSEPHRVIPNSLLGVVRCLRCQTVRDQAARA